MKAERLKNYSRPVWLTVANALPVSFGARTAARRASEYQSLAKWSISLVLFGGSPG